MNKADKADALLASGAVTPYLLRIEGDRTTGVKAYVKGEHGVYRAAAWYEGGRLRYRCSCDYALVHEVKCDCSHATAVGRLLT